MLPPVSHIHARTRSETKINTKRPCHVSLLTHTHSPLPPSSHILANTCHTVAHSHPLTHICSSIFKHILAYSEANTRGKERCHLHTHKLSEELRHEVSHLFFSPAPHPRIAEGFHLEVARALAFRLQSRPYRFPKDKAEKLISITQVERLPCSAS